MTYFSLLYVMHVMVGGGEAWQRMSIVTVDSGLRPASNLKE